MGDRSGWGWDPGWRPDGWQPRRHWKPARPRYGAAKGAPPRPVPRSSSPSCLPRFSRPGRKDGVHGRASSSPTGPGMGGIHAPRRRLPGGNRHAAGTSRVPGPGRRPWRERSAPLRRPTCPCPVRAQAGRGTGPPRPAYRRSVLRTAGPPGRQARTRSPPRPAARIKATVRTPDRATSGETNPPSGAAAGILTAPGDSRPMQRKIPQVPPARPAATRAVTPAGPVPRRPGREITGVRPDPRQRHRALLAPRGARPGRAPASPAPRGRRRGRPPPQAVTPGSPYRSPKLPHRPPHRPVRRGLRPWQGWRRVGRR